LLARPLQVIIRSVYPRATRTRQSRESMIRNGLHILLGVLLWVVFGYYWYIVFQRPITPHTRFALIAVCSIVAAITLFIVYWVLHNRRIARRNQRRARRLRGAAAESVDFLGRKIVSPGAAALARARYIEIGVVEMSGEDEDITGHKVFRIVDRMPGD
jgi:hypothetical protein